MQKAGCARYSPSEVSVQTQIDMADPEDQARRFYALIYKDDEGNEKSIWYSDREKAEKARQELKRECRIKVVRL